MPYLRHSSRRWKFVVEFVGKLLILLADEPNRSLGSKSGIEMMDLMLELHAEGATIWMVTQDPRRSRAGPRSLPVA